MKKGFDNAKYVKIQSAKIRERFGLFDKLYLEVGGKLFDDSHAARVLQAVMARRLTHRRLRQAVS